MKFKGVRYLAIFMLVCGFSVVSAEIFKNNTGMADKDLIIRWYAKDGEKFKGSNTDFASLPSLEKLREARIMGFQVLFNADGFPELTRQVFFDFDTQYELSCAGDLKTHEGKQICGIKVEVKKLGDRIAPSDEKVVSEEKLTEPGEFYANNKNKQPYEILGVAQDASEDEIKKAYKKLFLKWHPDKWQVSAGKTEQEEKDATEAFKMLSDARDAALKAVKK